VSRGRINKEDNHKETLDRECKTKECIYIYIYTYICKSSIHKKRKQSRIPIVGAQNREGIDKDHLDDKGGSPETMKFRKAKICEAGTCKKAKKQRGYTGTVTNQGRYTHIYIYIERERYRERYIDRYVCMYIYIYVHVHVCMYVYIYIYIYTHIIYIYIYIAFLICTYAHMCALAVRGYQRGWYQ